ncbi:MAG: hypothetical protein IPM02_23225 [Betaproteobacteria bacterium]|nr:hypothetical protein [Betaproteobacteria bacterium]
MALPADGECSANQSPVWRAYNNGFKPQQGINDGNHRFSVDRASIQKLVDSGWNDEGVVFCAQADNPSVPFNINVPTASLLLLPGASREVIVAIEPRNGFTGAVSLTASGLLPGVTHEFPRQRDACRGNGRSHSSARRCALGRRNHRHQHLHDRRRGKRGQRDRGNRSRHRCRRRSGGAAPRGHRRGREALPGIRRAGPALAGIRAGDRGIPWPGFPSTEETGVDADTISAWGRFKGGHVHIVANALE